MSMEIKKRHRSYFDKWSKVYDRSLLQHLVFNPSHEVFIGEMRPLLRRGSKILDVGCGTGKFAFKMANHNKQLDVHGVDLSGEMIEKAKEKLTDENITFAVGDVEELPYESGTFDIVTCSHSFHHYPNQDRAVSEMYRVLKDNGTLMIIDGSRDKLVGRVIFEIVTFIEGHVYHVLQREMRDLLMAAGFGKVRQRHFNPLAPLLLTIGHVQGDAV